SGPRVLLCPDTFTNFHEPGVGMAAAEILFRAGYRVSLGPPNLLCCGRPMISNGLLDEAVRHARHNVACLATWASEGHPITACEPSCILTIKDDYPVLLHGDERRQAEVIAAACRTFEELLDRLPPLNYSPGQKILVQGHCHQRSLVGMVPLLRVLRQIPAADVGDIDAG